MVQEQVQPSFFFVIFQFLSPGKAQHFLPFRRIQPCQRGKGLLRMPEDSFRQGPEQAKHPLNLFLAILGGLEGDMEIQLPVQDVSRGTNIVKILLAKYQGFE